MAIGDTQEYYKYRPFNPVQDKTLSKLQNKGLVLYGDNIMEYGLTQDWKSILKEADTMKPESRQQYVRGSVTGIGSYYCLIGPSYYGSMCRWSKLDVEDCWI
jgi:hypothetical protein